MKKFLTGVVAAALTAALSITSVIPAGAAPIINPSAPFASSDILKVQESRWLLNQGSRNYRRDFGRRDFGRRFDRDDFRGRDSYRGRYSSRDYGEYRNWRGHRGYRGYRRGYRERNGWWYPSAAFVTGAIIGGAIANDRRPVYRSGGGHTEWCYNRYRSYRASDNTFQPYNGGRQECYSPYS